MQLRYLATLLLLCFFSTVKAQTPEFTRADTLKGSITPEREWWDLSYYHLEVAVNPAEKSITGKNLVKYKVIEPFQVMQIDLQAPMKITSAIQNGESLAIRSEGAAHFIQLKQKQEKGAVNSLEISFEGVPHVAKRPPWDGGFTWTTDDNGKPFIATSNQGIGASIWWPNKDHPYDEVDSMMISVTVPEDLVDVSNGRLKKIDKNKDGTRTFHWYVSNPINNYGVNLNIGDYVHFGKKYKGEKGKLDCDYWVLSYNLKKAKEQFKDAERTLEAFEYWFGPYPFYEDSYKLVEAPYLGMEHQSSVTYGNGYKNGYKGSDLSQSGWGMKFDFIIIHESGHEWFANNITNQDVADMWIHESFTHYSENLFLDYHYGTQAANEYIQGVRSSIQNDRPIIGIYNVDHEGSGDMYYKGGNMLHTLRQLFNDDEKWRETLRGLNRDFYHQTVTSEQVENYLEKAYGESLEGFFDQYLRDVRIPIIEYRLLNGMLMYRWSNVNDNFNIPIKIFVEGEEKWINPVPKKWNALQGISADADIRVDPNFYVATFEITNR